jgi:DNA-binding IclR family transcriptional regulator
MSRRTENPQARSWISPFMSNRGRRTSGAEPRAAGQGGKPRKGIQSVEIGLRVLDALARADGPLPLKEISRATGLSASQAHRYLTSLSRQEMVVQDAKTGHYDLGHMAIRVGLAALSRIDAIEIAEEALRRLVDRVDLTGMLGIWGEHGPVAVRWRRGRSLIFASVGLGASFPLLGSATGQIFLAYLPPSITRGLVDAELADLARRGSTIARKDIPGIIAKVRHDRCAKLDGHLAPGIWAVSAPIFDSQGELVAALTLMGNPSDKEERRARTVDELRRAAAEASEKLGFADQWPHGSAKAY